MQDFSFAQAAFVVGEPVATFKKTVERAPVRPKVTGPQSRRSLVFVDLIFLHAYAELKREFTDTSRVELYQALRKQSDQASISVVSFGKHQYDLSDHYSAVVAKLKKLRSLAEQVDASGTEPLIKGTKVEVHRIAALLAGGATVERILADFPSLDEDKVRAAELYAAAHPKVGRPYPKTTAKQALEAVDLSVLDAV